jgi:hypothetical protein
MIVIGSELKCGVMNEENNLKLSALNCTWIEKWEFRILGGGDLFEWGIFGG